MSDQMSDEFPAYVINNAKLWWFRCRKPLAAFGQTEAWLLKLDFNVHVHSSVLFF